MKLFLTLALSAVSVASLFAASIPRMDVDATKKDASIKLTPGSVDGGFKVSNQNWGNQKTRQNRLTAALPKPIGDEWTVCKLVFTPETDGTVVIGFAGQWAKDPANRGWVAVSGLKINGEPVENSDLTKTYKKDNKTTPTGFWASSKTTYLPKGGPNGTGAMVVNHDNRMWRNVKVEGGKPVTIEYMAKAVDAVK